MRYFLQTTHQQRWRTRLRQTHDRFDVYLPRQLATRLRRALTGDDTVSMFVERIVVRYFQSATATPACPSDIEPAPEQAEPADVVAPERSTTGDIDHHTDAD